MPFKLKITNPFCHPETKPNDSLYPPVIARKTKSDAAIHSFIKITLDCFVVALLAMTMPAYAATGVPFTVTMSEPVNVTGCPANCPRITLDVGGVTRYADYSSGSGTSTLTFTYTTQAGDLDLDGITISSNAIDLNTSGTVKDLNGNNLSPLTFTIPNTSAVKVNHPSLSMDFINSDYILNGTHYATIPSFLTAASGTFTRASVGTYFDSAGVMQTAASGSPRFDYDPVTHAAKGILIEEARTNQLKSSNDFTSADWVRSSAGISPNTATAPDGTLSADKLIMSAVTSQIYILQDSSITSGNTYTQSIFVKVGELAFIQIGASTGFDSVNTWVNFNLLSGTIGNHGTNGTYRISSIGNGWYKISLTATATSTITGRFYFSPTATDISNRNPTQTGNGTSGLYIWGAQLEVGAFPTSYIPTTTAATTRQSDALTMPTGGWYSATRGTLSTQSILPYLGGNQYPGTASIDDGTGNNAIHLFINDAGSDSKNSEIFTGAVNQFSSGGAVYVAGSILKQGVYYNTNSSRMSMDGTLGTFDSSVTIPTVSILHVGARRSGSNPLNGWIQNVKYYPLPTSDTQLQLLTQ